MNRATVTSTTGDRWPARFAFEIRIARAIQSGLSDNNFGRNSFANHGAVFAATENVTVRRTVTTDAFFTSFLMRERSGRASTKARPGPLKMQKKHAFFSL